LQSFINHKHSPTTFDVLEMICVLGRADDITEGGSTQGQQALPKIAELENAGNSGVKRVFD
jgi:hypothetical protein